jgi:TRAP-type mannitol/chloroaromatic compound transport system permease small subunit
MTFILKFFDSFGDEEYPVGVQVVGWIFELLPTCVVIVYTLWAYKQ